MRFFQKIFLVGAMMFILSASPAAAQVVQDPGKLVVEAVDKGLHIVEDPNLQKKDRMPARRAKLWQELSPMFDFEEMSKRSLGRHWKERTDEEKKEFISLFTNLLKDAYLGKSDAYSGQRLVYEGEQTEGNRSIVQTKFITTSKEEIGVDFQMINRNDQWKIYDVVIEGVSLINNYRSQFNSILLKSSYQDLIQRMKEKRGIAIAGEDSDEKKPNERGGK